MTLASRPCFRLFRASTYFWEVAKLHYSIRRSILYHLLSQIAGLDERHVSGRRHSISSGTFYVRIAKRTTSLLCEPLRTIQN